MFRKRMVSGAKVIVVVAAAVSAPVSQGQEANLPTAERQQVAEQSINESVLRGHIRFLSDDLLEGRLPGSRGDELAQRYVAAQFEALGFRPAAPGGGWFQRVPLVGVTTHAPATDHAGIRQDRLAP